MTHIEKQEKPGKIEVSLVKEIHKFPELVETGKLLHTKVPKSDFISYWIETKYISPNPLQTRFFPKDDKIFIQLSPVLTKITKELKVQDGKKINIREPVGIGKSVAILHWVVCVRGHPFIRVFYINNPENLTNRWHLTIIKELIYTMARDIDTWEENNDESVVKRVNGKTMEESFVLHCQSLESERNTAGIIQLCNNYCVYCDSKGIYLVGVFYQKKHFERNHNQDLFFYDTMMILSKFHMTIYEISDVSNEAMSFEDPDIFLTEKFTIGQAINYLSEKMPENFLLLPEGEPKTRKEWKKFPEFKKIYDTTDFLPYELEKFVQEAIQNPNLPFKSIFENFYTKRYVEIAQIHNNWIKSYTFIPDSKVRYEFMYRMSLGLRETEPLLGLLVSPDPNLFYSDYTVNPSCVRFTSRIVENALFRLYSKDDNFWKAINSDLYAKFNALKTIINNFTQQSEFKGSFLENCFECTMRVASLRHSLLKNIRDKDTTYNLLFEDKEGKNGVIDLKTIERFVHFNDSQLPTLLTESLKRSGVEVLVPNSPGFEYVDFILVDTKKDPIILYLIQATINIYGHEKVDIALKSEYGTLLNENKEGKSKEVSFKSAKPISLAIYEVLKVNSKIKIEFIWVGLAYHYNEKKWLTVKEVFELKEGKAIDAESKVALVKICHNTGSVIKITNQKAK